jgi:hypothetical protein
MSLIYITTGFLAFFTATLLAIDVGMMTTARTQAQSAADSGALSGVIALVMDDWDDRTAGGPAVLSAMHASVENRVINADVSVESGDVTFPTGPGGQPNRVRVDVYRTAERSNPLSTFISGILGIHTVNMHAYAIAEAAPANAATCVRPFTIPDLWEENNTPANGTFDRYDNHGDVIPDADVYTPGVNGYDPERDKGTPLTLRAGIGSNIEPSFYFSWSMPPDTGADWYEENIRGCNPTMVHSGLDIIQEPGTMAGPTGKAIQDLIDQDPSAYWDDVHKKVVSPLGKSPRVFPIPLYDPDYLQAGITGGRGATLKIATWIGFFVEDHSGAEIWGRLVPMIGVIDKDAGPAPDDSFLKAVRLVE